MQRRPVLQERSRRILSGTLLQPIYWKEARIYALYKHFLATQISPQRKYIRTSQTNIFKKFTRRFMVNAGSSALRYRHETGFVECERYSQCPQKRQTPAGRGNVETGHLVLARDKSRARTI